MAKAGKGLSSAVPSFKKVIQQRDVAEPANEVSIIWRGSRDPKSHTIIQPELSGKWLSDRRADRQITYLH